MSEKKAVDPVLHLIRSSFELWPTSAVKVCKWICGRLVPSIPCLVINKFIWIFIFRFCWRKIVFFSFWIEKALLNCTLKLLLKHWTMTNWIKKKKNLFYCQIKIVRDRSDQVQQGASRHQSFYGRRTYKSISSSPSQLH